MTRGTLFAAVLFASVVAVFVWEQNSLTKLGQRNESLRVEKVEAERLAAENRDLPTLRAATPVSRNAIAELLRLRNEVHQVRAQKQEADKLRSENERLAAELKSGKITPRKLSDLEGFVGKESWANAGLATPEGALRSFFWAMSTTNFDQLLQCVTPATLSDLQLESQRDPERFRKDFFGEYNPFRKVGGFHIAERTIVSEDKVLLGIQVVADGEVEWMSLRRVGNEWKMDMPGEPQQKP